MVVPDRWYKYRKRPIEIQAKKITGCFDVDTLEGKMHGCSGDYLVKGIEGELYIVKASIFEATYDLVEMSNPNSGHKSAGRIKVFGNG